MTKKFDCKLRRAIRLFLRELRDGCPDCTNHYYCDKHRKTAYDVCLHPKKYITIKSDGTCEVLQPS